MADPFTKVSPGSPLEIPAAAWNAALEAAQRLTRERLGARLPTSAPVPPVPALRIYAKNTSGSTLPAFGVLEVSGTPSISVPDAPHEVRRNPMVPGITPTAETVPFVISIEPIANNDFGEATILGVTPCQVNVTDEAHAWARPMVGVTATLASATSGPARILWKAAGTGTVWALVLLQGASEPESAWKLPVRARTTAALPTNTYDNGTSGVGATLTGSSNGALSTLDGVSLAVNDRLLIADESLAPYNGIYVLTQVGDASNPYILTRATDADTSTKLLGACVAVEEGTTYADTVWLCTADAVIAVGETALPWVKVGPGITVQEQDGSPSYSVPTLQFHQTDGFVVSQPASGEALVRLSAATASQAGGVSTTTQTFGGRKTFADPVTFNQGWSYTGAGVMGPGGSGRIDTDTGQELAFTGTDSSGNTVQGILGPAATGGLEITVSNSAAPDCYLLLSDGGGFMGTAKAYYAILRSGVQKGVDATLAPGMTVTGGIITSAGSGSFVGTATSNTFTADNSFHPSTDVVPVTIQGGGVGTADLLDAKDAGGSTVAKIDASGNVTGASFSGSGSGLTNIPAGQLTGTVDGGTW